MSIAIHSSSASGRCDRAAEVPAARRSHDAERDARGAERTAESHGPRGRQALMGALSDALASLSPATDAAPAAGDADTAAPVDAKEQKAALHAFAHELFNALRPSGSEDGGPGRHGRGFAWGRTSVGDIAQRLEALAQSLTSAPAGTTPSTTPSKSTTPTPNVPADPAVAPAAEASSAAATAGASTASATPADAAATVAPAAAPAPTDTTAPACSTPVPAPAPAKATADSPLLAAFRQLTSASSGGSTESAPAVSAADQLAALLHRMALALTGASGDMPSVGSLVDVSA